MAEKKKTEKIQKNSIELFILDLDNTITDTLDFWTTATDQMLKAMHDMRGVPMQDLYSMIKKASAQYRWGNGHGLIHQIAEMPEMAPYLPQSKYIIAFQNAVASDVWVNVQKDKAYLFDGVVDFLLEAKSRNIPVVIDTDAEQSSVILRMWRLCVNTIEKDPRFKNWQPHEVLNLFSGFYTQENDKVSQCDKRVLYYVDPYFVSQFKHHAQTWPKGDYKPSNAHAKRIINEYKVSPKNTIMVGDTYKDAGTVRPQNNDGFHANFALAVYGMEVSQKTHDLHARTGCGNYKYGKAVTFNILAQHNIKPELCLEQGIDQLIPYMTPAIK